MTTLISDPLPLQTDADGVVRVAGTRVTLDVLVSAYDDGATAEEIHLRYDSVPLADIHSVIAFYLRHRSAVAEYLAVRQSASVAARERVAARQNTLNIRERLRSRTPS